MCIWVHVECRTQNDSRHLPPSVAMYFPITDHYYNVYCLRDGHYLYCTLIDEGYIVGMCLV